MRPVSLARTSSGEANRSKSLHRELNVLDRSGFHLFYFRARHPLGRNFMALALASEFYGCRHTVANSTLIDIAELKISYSFIWIVRIKPT